jgi:hypothetical protein
MQYHFNVIGEAPAPILARLEGGNDGMSGRAEMLARMPVLGLVAAPNMTTGSA